jgi:hypothetical protein
MALLPADGESSRLKQGTQYQTNTQTERATAMTPEFDERDAFILAGRKEELDKREGPRVGDWIRFADGAERRISHDWGDSFQYSEGGSFYLGNGYVSFSGGLEPGIPADSLKLTSEVKDGDVWFFHHDYQTAHNGVPATIKFRVYESSVNTHSKWCQECNQSVPGTHGTGADHVPARRNPYTRLAHDHSITVSTQRTTHGTLSASAFYGLEDLPHDVQDALVQALASIKAER